MSPLFSFFLNGIIIGFSIAAPVGPIGVLCIRRTLAHGVYIGILSGLGAATADAFYGTVAGFGLTSISSLLISYNLLLRIIGGTFLAYLGIKTFLSEPAHNPAAANGQGALSAFVSTFFLTITNPMTILSFAAILAGTGIVSTDGDYHSAMALVGGVFCGAAAWFTLLCSTVGLFRSQVDLPMLRIINKVSGLMIVAFAAYIFLGALWG